MTTLPASEETVPATDAEIAHYITACTKRRGMRVWQDQVVMELIARIKLEREQAVRECAEILNDYIAASRSDTEALGFEQARDAILSLIPIMGVTSHEPDSDNSRNHSTCNLQRSLSYE